MITWVELGEVGTLCAGVGAIATLWFNHSASDRAKAVKQAHDEAISETNIQKIPVLEEVLNKHLVECAEANGENKILLQQLQKAVESLATDMKHLLLKGH